ncbi:uncharacterized protein CC84DRAFT_436142 [Paraphaeosphaeria sporulosa]|uniref:Secreted protein n=1 Tax=Paraphaeosphaeria sporulosa TaxID=1460663 RepID=A0A177CRJ1_9PLEO|nr:uncharacterized protein CC84DRAFT_436142 [Paraphaeosphaeria sporulosa]OAG09397.1 hypothetical protein CC84DRAFT_436142 [Paraphaeosphaeria sporulosa]
MWILRRRWSGVGRRRIIRFVAFCTLCFRRELKMWYADWGTGNLQRGVRLSQLHRPDQCDLPDGVSDAGIWIYRCRVLEEGVRGQGKHDVGADGESRDRELLHFTRSV